MTEELTFYTNPMSRGQTVRWMLEEVGEPYATEILDYKTTMKAEPYLSINPMGKVPAIRHNGRVVTEVAAISGARLTLAQTILRGDTVLTRASVVVVAIRTSGGPARMPAAIRTLAAKKGAD